MAKVQANIDNELLKQIKKDAIDKDVTIGTYVSEALVSKLEQNKEGEKKEEGKTSINQS